MLRADIEICLELEGPMLTQSTAPGAYGIDAVAARDLDGTPYIAGSLVTGKLRQALEEMAACQEAKAVSWFKPDMVTWLGVRNPNGTPLAKQLVFSDFRFCQRPDTGARVRIRIDPKRGAIEKGAQLLVEEPFAVGEPLLFNGRLTFFSEDEATALSICRHVEAGLKWTAQMGAYRSIGFGRLRQVHICPPVLSGYNAVLAGLSSCASLDIVLQPESAFCLARKPIADNLFESEEVIPGAAILGSIASAWKSMSGAAVEQINELDDSERLDLRQHFNNLRVTHAFPSAHRLIRPVVPPLSLVKIKAESCKPYYDVALLDKPCLIHGQTPAFAVDWKDKADVLRDFGWPRLRTEMRVRTSIDRQRLRRGESELFAYEMIVPDAVNWQARVSLADSSLDDATREKIMAQLAGLLEHGIATLGKTKTPAAITSYPGDTIKSSIQSDPRPRDDVWVVTLQTPALLCEAGDDLIRPGNRANLHKAYAAAWKDISAGSLELVRFFARQSLAGGKYIYGRFQCGKKDANGKTRAYYPYLMTQEGSVFVLRAADGEEDTALDCIKRWLAHGLDLPGWAVTSYQSLEEDGIVVPGNHWQNCPYIPQNGFGEIVVNLDVHWDNRPNTLEEIDWLGEEDENG